MTRDDEGGKELPLWGGSCKLQASQELRAFLNLERARPRGPVGFDATVAHRIICVTANRRQP